MLAARAEHPGATLSDLYDPDFMPSNLRRADHSLNLAVDRLYRRTVYPSERERVEHLIGRWGFQGRLSQLYYYRFLCFMTIHLLEMRRVVKPAGNIYLHCDPTTSHYLKELMDSVFDHKCFVNEIIWHFSSGGSSKTFFPRNTMSCYGIPKHTSVKS